MRQRLVPQQPGQLQLLLPPGLQLPAGHGDLRRYRVPAHSLRRVRAQTGVHADSRVVCTCAGAHAFQYLRGALCTHTRSQTHAYWVCARMHQAHTLRAYHMHTLTCTHTPLRTVCVMDTQAYTLRPLHRLRVVCTHRHILKDACILIHTHSHTLTGTYHTWSHCYTHAWVCVLIHIPTFTHPLILTLYPLVLTVAHLRMHSDIHTCVRTTRYSATHIGTDSEHTYTPIFTPVDMPTQSCTLRGTLSKKRVCPHSHVFMLRLTVTHLDVCSHTHALVRAHTCIHTCSSMHTLCSKVLVHQHSRPGALSA